MKRNPQAYILPLGAAALAASGLAIWRVTPMWYGIALAAASLIAMVLALIVVARHNRITKRLLDDVLRENDTVMGRVARDIAMPALVFSDEGHIIWRNKAFSDVYEGNDVRRIFPDMNLTRPSSAQAITLNGRSFQVMTMPLERHSGGVRRLAFQYWIDRTEANHYFRLYEEQMPTVALIYVDNYEELNADKQFHRNAVLAEVEKCVAKFVSDIEGAYRRYDSSKFFVVFEAKRVAELEKQRFALLDEVHNIDTGTGQTVTLSISVGLAERVMRSDESARQGMELALGRGGDQAVVKRGTSYSFYGGKHQVSTKNSRVKARLFAKALRQLMENSEQTVIMGHSNPDMDCIGASLGLMRCAAAVGRSAYLVLDGDNPGIETVLGAMREAKQYEGRIKTAEQAEAIMRPGTVLVIVDTQRESTLLSPALYRLADKTVIIDHHRRPVDALETPTLHFLEAGASSTAEMVTEVIQYFDENIRLNTLESGALLAGITLDTKHFAFNTGARTFEAASYLRRVGADNSLVKRMFQDDMQTYRDRAAVVEGALVMERGIAISTCPQDMENTAIIAAQAADELISIKGISASFVLAANGEQVLISGRSLGEINVQVILERLGGGGHLTVAGAQLKNAGMDDAVQQLTESIREYLKEETQG